MDNVLSLRLEDCWGVRNCMRGQLGLLQRNYVGIPRRNDVRSGPQQVDVRRDDRELVGILVLGSLQSLVPCLGILRLVDCMKRRVKEVSPLRLLWLS